jgi:hypothetical protein
MCVDPYPSEACFAVRCLCGVIGPKRESKKEAIKAWNTRDQHLIWNPFRLLIRFPNDVPSADFKGNLASLDFASILQMLSSGEKTGILHVSRSHTKSVICLKEGNIVAASDSNGLRLGQILYKKGMISQQDLLSALKTAKKNNKMIGETLLGLGYISQITLNDLIYQQVQEAVLEIFFWKEGNFEYRDCVIEFHEATIRHISTIEIIMESVRRLDERDDEMKQEKRFIHYSDQQKRKERIPKLIGHRQGDQKRSAGKR